MDGHVVLGIVCALCITGLESYALSKGINGMCLTFSISFIAGIGGFAGKGILDKYRNEKDE